MNTVKEREFEKRAKYLGAKNFRESAWDKEFDYLGARIHYMVTHGRSREKGVPVGGSRGIDHVAKKMAEVSQIKGGYMLHSGDSGYFKKILKGYTPVKKLKKLEKMLKVFIFIFASLSIPFAFLAISTKITGYAIGGKVPASSIVPVAVLFIIVVTILFKLLFKSK